MRKNSDKTHIILGKTSTQLKVDKVHLQRDGRNSRSLINFW